MANDTPLNTPIVWVNKYLQYKLSSFGFSSIPFFPSVPSTIDALTQSFPSNEGVMSTYDRLFKINKKSFPHIKCEQMFYYFYATEQNTIPNMIQVTEIVYRLLDRFDESAEELNNWCANRRINLGTSQTPNLIDNIFYFHNFKVYQLEETRDILDFGSVRTYGGNKLIVEFDYHQTPIDPSNRTGNTDKVMYSDWQPEHLAEKEIV